MTSVFKLLVFWFACYFLSSLSSMHAKCLNDQRSYLLQFKNAVIYRPDDLQRYTPLNWNESMDCCKWEGVVCDGVGHVISLSLARKMIHIRRSNEDWKSIFNLQYLEELQLSRISFGFHLSRISFEFHDIAIPEELYNLTRLKYLDLSKSHFSGQIPIGLSKLTSLVTLDLSAVLGGLEVKNRGGLEVLFQNLTQLQQLYLDFVDISAGGNAWCNAFSSLSKLQVLSLSQCQLSGPILPSLSNLSSLTTIQLDQNPLNTIIPDYFSNFTNLRTLRLLESNLLGQFPEKIFQIPTLEFVDLTDNGLLGGSLPQQFPKTGALKEMYLSGTNFSGSLPDSIVYLKALSALYLSFCSFSGPIPSSLFSLPSLQYLRLSHNHFDGEIEEFQIASSSSLVELDLISNNFIGSIPKSFFHLKSIQYLDLSFNSFNGTLRLDMFNKFKNLIELDISHNNLSIDASCSTCLSSFPQLSLLGLASCNLKMFPDLRNLTSIHQLDLSLNNITGKIPNWVWTISPSLSYLNLSCNLLVDLQKPYLFPISLKVLDLHANLLKGEIPIPRPGSCLPKYVEYSNNNFTTSIPSNIGEYIFNTTFFSLSHNNIQGHIPKSICNGTLFEVLDLSNNVLRGKIPKCLFGMVHENLAVLNLGGNKLGGYISNTFRHKCGLRTLDLSRNSLRGMIPTSLANCKSLQVFNVGNNNLKDNFPCTLIKSLSVLVLRSNMFHGEINCSWGIHSWPSLQILDVSHNNFSGVFPPQLFLNCKGMIVANSTGAPPLQFHMRMFSNYQDSVKLVVKGSEVELVKIQTFYKTLDFPCNNFHGNIPIAIGELRALYSLNLSHNALTGTIPKSFGKLEQLESLDLSTNQLTGRVPTELENLTFLQVLNLSYNHLNGKIPDGRHLQTFPNSSFLGNKGLCGFPLSVSCDHGLHNNGSSISGGPSEKKGIDLEFVSAALGFSVGIGIILWMNILNPVWWRRFNSLIIQFLFLKVFGVNVLERPYRNPIRRV